MTDEAKKEFEKFKATQGLMLIELFERYITDVEENYGKDVATGFTLGLDMVHLALTGLSLGEALNIINSNANSTE